MQDAGGDMNIADVLARVGNLFRWWVTVAPWEQAVRVRLGKHVEVLGAGVHLRIPGVDRVFRQSTRRRFTSVPTQTVTTKDGRTITISGALAYAIGDIGKLYDTVHHAEDTLETEAQASVAKFIRAHTLDLCDPGEVEKHVTEDIDLSRYGIVDVEFSITDFAVVRTFRLITGEPKNWSRESSPNLSTNLEDGVKA